MPKTAMLLQKKSQHDMRMSELQYEGLHSAKSVFNK